MGDDHRKVRNLVNGNKKSQNYEDIYLSFFVKYPMKIKSYTSNAIGIEF